MTRRLPDSTWRGVNGTDAAKRAARDQRIPFAFTRPKPLRPGQEYRRIAVRGTEDADDATARARTLPWWRAVTREQPVRASSGWWLWTIRTARLA